MNIEIPKAESIGKGRLVRCDSCFSHNHIGSMISVELSAEGQLTTKLVCSIGCLSNLLKGVVNENPTDRER